MAHSHSILKNFDILIGFMWLRNHNNSSSMRSVNNSRSLSSVMVHVILPFRVQALIAYILTGALLAKRGERGIFREARNECS